MKLLTDAQARVLRNLGRGYQSWHHCRCQSDYGGLEGTRRALVRRGLMDWDDVLTWAGAVEAARLLRPQQGLRNPNANTSQQPG